MEIRKLTDNDREAYSKIVRYAFEPTRNNYENLEFPEKEVPNDWLFGAFEDNILASGATVIDFPAINIRNQSFKMGGIAGVATKPEFRNRGASKALFLEIFKDMITNQVPISVLYPFKYSYYERLGYYLSDEFVFYQFEIENIIKKNIPDFHFKEVNSVTDDIKIIYGKITQKYNFMANRSDYLWERRAKSKFKYVCYHNEEPVGYIFLHFLTNESDPSLKEPGNTIWIAEVFWLDNLTKQAIFNFLWTHRDQKKYVCFGAPLSENIIDMLKSPQVDRRVIRSNSMVRIIDVKAVLEKLEFKVKNFDLILRIHDNQCVWNDKCFDFSVKNGTVSVETSDSNKFDLEIEIGRFSQLVVGSRTIEDFLEFDLCKLNPEKKELLLELFPKCVNFLRDFF
ncbi:MAG: GNAT family N-acetyltransferase [Candidatus Hodarchaeales archaeon]